MTPCCFYTAEGNVDPSVDIYAFGILMYELATARPVYPSLPSEYERSATCSYLYLAPGVALHSINLIVA
jgi:serine/threonine protein kinase